MPTSKHSGWFIMTEKKALLTVFFLAYMADFSRLFFHFQKHLLLEFILFKVKCSNQFQGQYKGMRNRTCAELVF